MPSTRARISTCRELSAWATHSNVIGTSCGSTFTAVTSIVWMGAMVVFSFLQPTTRSAQTRTVPRAVEQSGRIEIRFSFKSCQRRPQAQSRPEEATAYDRFLDVQGQAWGASDFVSS